MDWVSEKHYCDNKLDKKTRSIKQRQEALVIYAEAFKRKSEGEENSALEIIKEAIKKSPDLICSMFSKRIRKIYRKNKKC